MPLVPRFFRFPPPHSPILAFLYHEVKIFGVFSHFRVHLLCIYSSGRICDCYERSIHTRCDSISGKQCKQSSFPSTISRLVSSRSCCHCTAVAYTYAASISSICLTPPSVVLTSLRTNYLPSTTSEQAAWKDAHLGNCARLFAAYTEAERNNNNKLDGPLHRSVTL